MKESKMTKRIVGAEIITRLQEWFRGMPYQAKLAVVLLHHLTECKSETLQDMALELIPELEDSVLRGLGLQIEPEMTAFTCGLMHKITDCGVKV